MNLDALPPEIISKICRYIGIEVTSSHPNCDWDRPVVINRLRDFQSLRITCKVFNALFILGIKACGGILVEFYHLGCKL